MRKVLIAVAAFVVVVAGAALPSGAGGFMEYVVTIDPTSGEAGTEVTFTPTDACPSINTGAVANAPGDYSAAVSRVQEPSSPSDFVADTLVDGDGDGDWELTYSVPSDEPEGEITFYAFCLYEQWPIDVIAEGTTAAVPDDYVITAQYEPVVFTVTAPPVTTTTTSTIVTTTTTTAPAPAIVASPTNVFPGDTIAVNASGFKPGSDVVITLESDPVNLGTFVADSAGRIATNIVVPTDFPAGNHTIKLTGTDIGGAVLVLTTGITVGSRIQVVTTTAARAATTGTLPQTGSPVTEPALLIGGALVLAGAGALVAARRRRTSAR